MDIHRSSFIEIIVEDIFVPLVIFLWKCVTYPFIFIGKILGRIVKDTLMGVYGKFIGFLAGLVILTIGGYIASLIK